MNGLFLRSTLSLVPSSQPRSIISEPTSASSNDTAEGIGSLGGRVLYALGEATLRGFENLAIRRKLRSIKSIFPHQDTDKNKNIGKIYDDVLELSRPGLYHPQVRKQVLKLLLVQIGIRQTHHLIRSLVKWPLVELTLFLAELMACMPHQWLPPGTTFKDIHLELGSTYFTCQTITGYLREYHPASPLVDFMVAFAHIDVTTCQAVLDAGFLDMLLCMYICGFSCDIMAHSVSGTNGKLVIMEACTDALLQLCEYPGALIFISNHPLRILWPPNRPLSLRLGWQTKNRPSAWRQLGPVVVARRLATIPSILELSLPDSDSPVHYLIDACVDLVEFSRHMIYGSEIAEDALRCIRRCVELRKSHWTALNSALDDIHPTDRDDVFRRLMLRGPSIKFLLEKVPLWFNRRTTFPVSAISSARPIEHHGRTMSLPAAPIRKLSHDPLPIEAVYHNKKASHPEDPWIVTVEKTYSRIFEVAWNRRHSRWSINTHVYEAPEPCLAGTRDLIFDRIKDWINNVRAASERIFWLQGTAGEGKSAIASSVSRWFNDTRRYLGASFVFSRDDSHRRDSTFLFTTIAVQLAKQHHTMNQYVCRAMDEHGNRRTSSACDEFNLFLKQPMEATANQAPFTIPIVIVLDGIDEQWEEEPFRKDIFAMFILLHQLPAYVKILITSRPRQDLQAVLDSVGFRVQAWSLGDIPVAIVAHDIAKFITFRMVLHTHKHAVSLYDAECPRRPNIMALAEKLQGNFGWASRVMDFIESTDGDLEQRLDEVLNSHHAAFIGTFDSPGVDAIYNKMLDEAYPDDCPTVDLLLFHDVIGAVATVRRTISLHALCTLLGFISSQSAHVVSKLRTVVTISRQEITTQRRMIDPFFTAYLTSNRCPPRFFIDYAQHDTALAVGSLLRMRESLRGKLSKEYPLPPSTIIKDSEGNMLHGLPDDLQYACQFFAEHTSGSSPSSKTLYEHLHTFFCQDLRNWLDALCVLGLIDQAGEYLGLIQMWIDSYDRDDGRLAMLIPDIQLSIYKSKLQLTSVRGCSHTFIISISPYNSISVLESGLFSSWSMPQIGTSAIIAPEQHLRQHPWHSSHVLAVRPSLPRRESCDSLFTREFAVGTDRWTRRIPSSTVIVTTAVLDEAGALPDVSSRAQSVVIIENSAVQNSSEDASKTYAGSIISCDSLESELLWGSYEKKEAARYEILRILCSSPIPQVPDADIWCLLVDSVPGVDSPLGSGTDSDSTSFFSAVSGDTSS